MFAEVPLSHELTRVLVMFESALKEAEMLDAEFAATGVLRGPLHGVPVSLKDICAFLDRAPISS